MEYASASLLVDRCLVPINTIGCGHGIKADHEAGLWPSDPQWRHDRSHPLTSLRRTYTHQREPEDQRTSTMPALDWYEMFKWVSENAGPSFSSNMMSLLNLAGSWVRAADDRSELEADDQSRGTWGQWTIFWGVSISQKQIHLRERLSVLLWLCSISITHV